MFTGHPFEKLNEDQKSRIVGGVDAPEGYAAHMAALVWGDTVKSLMCGGSIVSKQHILTAAHCIDPMVMWGGELMSSFHAVVGSNQWNSNKTIAKFSHHVNHPNWDWVTIKNDIGVLMLEEKLELNARVAIAPLSFEWVHGGTPTSATGWGRIGTWSSIPYNLQLLHMETISPQLCAEAIREASQTWGPAPPLNSEVELCTFHSVGHGMCNGDSGSALISRETGCQIGVVSWGFPCAIGAPDVFVRINPYKSFLLATIGDIINSFSCNMPIEL
ncbi:unnamed protein product [Parnassius mnemosyne]|uniref:trypsin n=1 Tax=Parnassius mnemosyne TaxID=213953 RepID=A0AAV1KJ38_9NEOP